MRKKTCTIMIMLMSLSLSACGTTDEPKSSMSISIVEDTSETTEADNTTAETSESADITEASETDDTTTDKDTETADSSSTDEIPTTTDVDSNEITINYPSGYFEDAVDIMLEMDSEKTQANLQNSSDIDELFGSSARMGSFLGLEDNGYFLMIIGAGVYYEGTWDHNDENGFIATYKDLNSGEEESLEFDTDDESGQFVTSIYGEKVYWKIK